MRLDWPKTGPPAVSVNEGSPVTLSVGYNDRAQQMHSLFSVLEETVERGVGGYLYKKSSQFPRMKTAHNMGRSSHETLEKSNLTDKIRAAGQIPGHSLHLRGPAGRDSLCDFTSAADLPNYFGRTAGRQDGGIPGGTFPWLGLLNSSLPGQTTSPSHPVTPAHHSPPFPLFTQVKTGSEYHR